MQNTRSHKRRDRNPKLPEFAKNLNGAQRGLLTKFTRTGQVDPRNRVTEERHIRKAAWERRQSEVKEVA